MPTTCSRPLTESARRRRKTGALGIALALAALGFTALRAADAPADLPRRAYLGARAEFAPGAEPGARILRVVPDSPAARAGWEPGDLVVEADGDPVADQEIADRVIRRPVAGRPILYRWRRGDQLHESQLDLVEVPREHYAHATITYASLPFDGDRQARLLFSRPEGAARHPALLVVGWLSAASIEAPDTAADGSSQVFRGLIERSGCAVLRVEKPGVGDSEGVLAATDFTTELEVYRAALAWLRRQPSVDPDRIFILGTSNGGGIAPLVARTTPVRGYLVEGAWARTWFEHMLAIERRRMTFLGHPPAQVNREMQQIARLQSEFLIGGRAPAAILAESPDLRPLWPDRSPATLYGRPPAFYQQLQALNLAEAWSRVDVPVLVLHGEFDWVMDRAESEFIVACVNRGHRSLAELRTMPRRGHTFSGYASLADAFADNETPFDPAIVDELLAWLRPQAAAPAPRETSS
jgi:pimeloyl-ACP methyl ester carboxylesterase